MRRDGSFGIKISSEPIYSRSTLHLSKNSNACGSVSVSESTSPPPIPPPSCFFFFLQNKIDLVKEQAALQQYEDIKAFIEGTVAEKSPIIPISAQLRYNIDVVAEYMAKKIPIPVRDFTSDPRMIIIRSFDVNKPGEEVCDLKGGVAGGSILCGVLKKGAEIEIRPGIVKKDSEGKITCTPILSKISSLFAEQNELEYAVPGGLIGVGTKIDPTLTRADRWAARAIDSH